MSTSGLSLGSGAGSPISITGLASGLDTSAIIAALMAVEREPVVHLSDQQAKLQGEQQHLQSIQTALQQLALMTSEFGLPSTFESSQAVSSSEPLRVSAAASSGAAIGGHEVEVTQLANSAQRSFTFSSPAGEETLTVDGVEFTLKAGETAKQLASAINSNSSATVYAAVVEGETLVLSNRATGNTGAAFIEVSGSALSEIAGSAKEGKNAEFTVDGTAGVSASNTVTNGIAGVTLTLEGLTTTGPVTIDVQPPGPNVKAVEAQAQAFIKLYNSTVEAIHAQLTTKPIKKPQEAAEFGVGTLFGDSELTSLLNTMRQSMYAPGTGLPAEMSSPADIGISTGAATGAASSQSSIEGLLTLNTTKLTEAVQSNPAGVEQMLTQWSQGLQTQLNGAAQAGGSMEGRVTGDATQISRLGTQIATMNELLEVREKTLQETYAQLERAISQNTAQGQSLSSQSEALFRDDRQQ